MSLSVSRQQSGEVVLALDPSALLELVLDLDREYRLPSVGPDGATYRTPGELRDAICRSRPELLPEAVWRHLRDRLLAAGTPRDRLTPDVRFEELVG